mmetsp:Transcript_92700/g.233051  ORF Transcript_92700/g.233051 Transcript_92700/m.233051 type:complete len:141 (+) Transcript_92700:347-769(+)
MSLHAFAETWKASWAVELEGLSPSRPGVDSSSGRCIQKACLLAGMSLFTQIVDFVCAAVQILCDSSSAKVRAICTKLHAHGSSQWHVTDVPTCASGVCYQQTASTTFTFAPLVTDTTGDVSQRMSRCLAIPNIAVCTLEC